MMLRADFTFFYIVDAIHPYDGRLVHRGGRTACSSSEHPVSLVSMQNSTFLLSSTPNDWYLGATVVGGLLPLGARSRTPHCCFHPTVVAAPLLLQVHHPGALIPRVELHLFAAIHAKRTQRALCCVINSAVGRVWLQDRKWTRQYSWPHGHATRNLPLLENILSPTLNISRRRALQV